MKRIALLLFFIVFTSCLEREVSLSLLPNTIEKSINRFNFCLNHIAEPNIFYTIDQVLIGRALEDYNEFIKLISYTEQGKTSSFSIGDTKSASIKLKNLKNEIEEYISRANALKIRVVKITKKNDKLALALCYYYDTVLINETKKVFTMVLDDGIWKISKISDM